LILAKAYPGDFEVQLAASEIKERVLTRGAALKKLGETGIARAWW